MIFSDGAHGTDGFRAIGKRITGACDASNAYPWFFFKHPLHIYTGLFRRKDGAGDTWPGLIHAVILTVTEIAFYIAFWR